MACTCAEDALGEILLEIAEKKYSVASIQKSLAGYGYNVSTETAETIKELFDDTASMPVNMYEAKPERAVGFEEVKFAVVPDDIDAQLRSQLEQVVPDVREYAAGDESARLNQLNSRGDVKFSLRGYDGRQKKQWENSKRIVLYEDDAQLLNFVEDALRGKNLDKKIYLGIIPQDMADDIIEKTGVDVAGYNASIVAQEIRKINKDHGDETSENLYGQRVITSEDYLKVKDILQDYDSVELSEKTYMGKPVLIFEKTIDSSKSTVVAVVSDKRMDLFLQTMYAGKKKSFPTATGEQAPVNTPKATSGTALIERVPQSSDSVKKFSRRTLTPEDREMLMSLADKYAETKAQKELVGRYRKKVEELRTVRVKLEETREDILRRQMIDTSSKIKITLEESQKNRQALTQQENGRRFTQGRLTG